LPEIRESTNQAIEESRSQGLSLEALNPGILESSSGILDSLSPPLEFSNSASCLRILLVEDNPGDADLVRESLADARNLPVRLKHCSTLAPALELLKQESQDIVLLDLSLPDSSGLGTVLRVREVQPLAPIIVLTGLDDDALAVETVRQGAQDYLVKGQINSILLVRAIRYAIERKRTEVELKKKNAELQALNEEKNSFVGMAAHDLRNPLAVLLNYSEFLLDGCVGTLTPEETRVVATMRKTSKFMLSLINDLLDVSKIESGKVKLELAPVNLKELVSENVALNQVLAAKKGIQVKFECPQDIPSMVLDALKIEQVLNNLITNAVKFSGPGTVAVVELERNNGNVRLAVRDQGQGIPAEELGRLFEPFSRTSVKPTSGEKSTGLGLFIARRIIEAHHGTIKVESEVGKGATFTVTLPAA